MSDQAAKMIEVEFVKSPSTMDADFGDVKFVSVGNVEIGLEETADGVVITAKDAYGEETALVRHGKDGKDVDFETDETLSLVNGVLSVNTAEAVEKDNTLPVTSAAVYTEVGNINALLATI